jgi:hypothetical protein
MLTGSRRVDGYSVNFCADAKNFVTNNHRIRHNRSVQTDNVDDVEALGTPMLEEIRRNAELRLRQIEPLIEEAEQLRRVLDAIAKRPARREPARSSSRGAARADAAAKRPDDSTPRAKKGANKRIILELVERRPGITPAEIAKLTGMKRTVAASTVSRLKRYGYLREHEQGGVCLGRAIRAADADVPGHKRIVSDAA